MNERAEASFGSVKQIEAGDLDVGYVEAGPPGGQAVVLFHGWPYDIHSYAEATPMLAAEGYRVIVPHFRGYGVTRFLSDDTPRNGQQAAMASMGLRCWMRSGSIRRSLQASTGGLGQPT